MVLIDSAVRLFQAFTAFALRIDRLTGDRAVIPASFQKRFEQHECRDRVDPFLLLGPAISAAAHSTFCVGGRESLVKEANRLAGLIGKPARELTTFSTLLALAPVAMDREPDDQADDMFFADQTSKVLSVFAPLFRRVDFERAGENSIGVADGDADTDGAEVDRGDAALGGEIFVRCVGRFSHRQDSSGPQPIAAPPNADVLFAAASLC